jgi:hypothetical protein
MSKLHTILLFVAGCSAAPTASVVDHPSTTTGTGGTGGGGNVVDDAGLAEADLPEAGGDGDVDAPACSPPDDAQGCGRCLLSKCCNELAACRANADCMAGIVAFDQCLAQGNDGVTCLVDGVAAAGDGALFASTAGCSDEQCKDLSCPF